MRHPYCYTSSLPELTRVSRVNTPHIAYNPCMHATCMACHHHHLVASKTLSELDLYVTAVVR
jgi:hypothetical protein